MASTFSEKDFIKRHLLSLLSTLGILVLVAAGSPDEKRVDFRYFLVGQLQFAGAHDSFGLKRSAGSDDGPGDGGIVQRPCDCDFSGRPVVASADLLQAFNQRQIAREIWLSEVGMILAPIVFG